MRAPLVSLICSCCLATLACGKLPPLTAKDISLMLRTGYPAASVEKEVAARHFVGIIDAAAEKSLSDAGASAKLIADLKNGVHAVPAAELAATQAEAAAAAKRRAAQAEEARKFDTLYQHQQAEARAKAVSPAPPNIIAPLLHGDLVTSHNGSLTAYNDQAMEKKKLIALYFSAHWCAPCRKFTPELVAYYNRVAPAHPEFEVVFISADRSAPAMEAYMRDTQMPWPGVLFDRIAAKTELLKYAGSGIPCLVVLDSAGNVLSDSFSGGNYVGPGKVLADLDQMFGAVQTAAR